MLRPDRQARRQLASGASLMLVPQNISLPPGGWWRLPTQRGDLPGGRQDLPEGRLNSCKNSAPWPAPLAGLPLAGLQEFSLSPWQVPRFQVLPVAPAVAAEDRVQQVLLRRVQSARHAGRGFQHLVVEKDFRPVGGVAVDPRVRSGGSRATPMSRRRQPIAAAPPALRNIRRFVSKG